MTARIRNLFMLGGLCALPLTGLMRPGGLFLSFYGIALSLFVLFRIKEGMFCYPWLHKQNRTWHVLFVTYQSLLFLSCVLFLWRIVLLFAPLIEGYWSRLFTQGGAYFLLCAVMLGILRTKTRPTRIKLIGAACLSLGMLLLLLYT